MVTVSADVFAISNAWKWLVVGAASLKLTVCGLLPSNTTLCVPDGPNEAWLPLLWVKCPPTNNTPAVSNPSVLPPRNHTFPATSTVSATFCITNTPELTVFRSPATVTT